MEVEGIASNNSKPSNLSIEQDQDKGTQNEDCGLTSAHTIDHDSWQQVGLLLVTSYNCGWILTFSNLILVPLGWKWGIICLIVVGLYVAYANWLLASFHVIDGQRFIRYRDLMGFVYGKNMYRITWTFQCSTLLLVNMGFILLGGKALKEINSEFHDSPLRLQYYIVITGALYFLFSFFIPTISAMRNWLGASAVLTLSYIIMVLIVLVKDGKSNSNKDFHISGSEGSKVFNAFGAISAVIVCNTGGLLLEIQSTLRKPPVKNMRKALYSQFTMGVMFYYGVTIVGYWAYGSMVSAYLPQNFSGPRWINVLINAIVFLQSITSQHVFAAPIHEALDTRFLDVNKGMHSGKNLKNLFLLRVLFFLGNTLVTAAFPFMGDFVNLLGSFSLVPLTFTFPSMVFIKVKGKKTRTAKKAWHWFNIVFSSLLTVATTISAVRLIVDNIQKYQFFADA
ncbi:PREDICTED: proline transporter 2-like isoform X1 [Lupinus angustifolius]|uniref:proline transporter 2-like isoform X1 n=1 Tax=Lupinus angustifolius TaxID=3871 RepID=UPI00092F7C2F|nr:PREDICTED: proline transporter 2-like isoform X1 [Lupinus angustifolius]